MIHNGFTTHFSKQLKKYQIYEPNVYGIWFDNTLVLVGGLYNANNLNRILDIAKMQDRVIKSGKKPLNLLIYNVGPRNKNLESFVKNQFGRDKYLHCDRYSFFSMGRTVWVIGWVYTCYEKEEIVKTLIRLRNQKKINDFYCFLRYSNKNARGFVYRHL